MMRSSCRSERQPTQMARATVRLGFTRLFVFSILEISACWVPTAFPKAAWLRWRWSRIRAIGVIF